MTSEQPNHKIFIDEYGFVRAVYHGDLDYDTAVALHEQGNEIFRQLIEQGKEIKVLLDIRDLGKHDPTTRWLGQEQNKDLPIKRAAVILAENDPYTTKILELVAERSYHKDKIRFFKTEEDAIAWLQEPDSKTS